VYGLRLSHCTNDTAWQGVTCDNYSCDHFDCGCVDHHLCKERWGWGQAIIMSVVW